MAPAPRPWLAPAALGAAVLALALAAYAAGRTPADAPASPPAPACECPPPAELRAAVQALEREVSGLRLAVERASSLSAVDAGLTQAAAADETQAPEPMLAVDVARAMEGSLGELGPKLRSCLRKSGEPEPAPATPVEAVFQLDAAGEITELRLEPSALSEAAQTCLLEVLMAGPRLPSGTHLSDPVTVRQALPLSAD